MKEAVWEGPILRKLNSHVFYSFFSSYVEGSSADWTAQVAETALQMLSEGSGIRYGQDWLLETAFHGNLATSGTEVFHQNISRIEAALQRLEHDGLTCSSQYVRGLLAYARGDLQIAESAFQALPDLAEAQLLAHHSGYAAFRAPDFYRTLKSYKPSIRLQFIRKPDPKTASVVFLCAVDDLYFAAFAAEFVERALAAAPSTHVHFHLIDNKIDLAHLTDSYVLTSDRVSISAEQTGLSDPGTYAIMARYIILPIIMQEWDKPVLVTDVDLHIRSDPTSLGIRHPVTLCVSHVPAAIHMPASAVLGGHNLFQPTEAGRSFADTLSRYLHYMCANGRGLWAADQVALLMVWRMLRNVVPVGQFRDLASYSWGAPDRPAMKRAAEERLREL